MGLYFVVCIFEIIIEILSIVKLKKTKENKYYNMFMGISSVSFVFNVLTLFVLLETALGLGDTLLVLFTCGLLFFSNIILFIVSYIVKINLKTKNIIKLSRSFVWFGFLTLLLNIIVVFGIPSLTFQVTFNTGKKKVINYLENKYGDLDYEVIDAYEEYSDNGIVDSYLSGYYYEVKCNYMDEVFFVSIDDNFNYVYADYFLPVYYSQKYDLEYSLSYDDFSNDLDYDFSEFEDYINKIIKDKYPDAEEVDVRDIYSNFVNSWSSTSGVEYDSNYYIVPSDGGRVPTIDELISSLVKEVEA